MSLLLHHFSLSPPTPRSLRPHFEHFHRMPNSSHPPTDRNQRVISSDWDPGGWRTTTQLQRRSSSANLSNTQVWSRSFDESSMSVQEPSSYRKPIQQSRSSMACTSGPSPVCLGVCLALPDETDRIDQTDPTDQTNKIAGGLFQHPAETHILLPDLSVECYSRGGHEVISAFPYDLLALWINLHNTPPR